MATIVAAAGGGNWNTGATWVGGVVPSATSDVQLDATSGNVTINGASACRSLDCTGYTGTLTHNIASTLTVGDATAGTGNKALKLVAGMTYTINNATSSSIVFASTNATQQTVDSAGKTLANVTFAGAGGSWILSSAITISAFIINSGTLDTNGQTVIATSLQSTGSLARTLSLGASTITLSAASPVVFSGSNLTFNCGTSSITATSNSWTWNGGGKTFYNVTFSAAISSTSTTMNDANTFNDLNLGVGTNSKLVWLNFSANQTINGTLTVKGNTILNRLLIRSSAIGTQITITVNGSVVTEYTNWQDIAGAGSASWNLSAITGGSGDCGGNSGITFTTAATQTATGTASFTWSTHGWTTRVPLPQDDVVISNAFIAGRTVTCDMPNLGKNVTINPTGSPIVTLNAFTDFYVTGNFSISSCTPSGTGAITFSGRSGGTVTANVTMTQGLGCDAAGATYTLLTNWTTTGTPNSTCRAGTFDVNGKTIDKTNLLTHTGGTFNINGGTIKLANGYVSSGSLARTLAFGTSGAMEFQNTAVGNPVNATGTNLTITGTGTMTITTVSANTRTFIGGGNSWPVLTYTVAGSTGSLVITGSNTFDTINFSDSTNARSLLFTAGTTTTVTNWNVNGTSGKLMTVDSVTNAVHFLSKLSGAVSSDYLSVKNSNAGGGATWYAGANSTNVSGNTGWIFTAPGTASADRSLLMGV